MRRIELDDLPRFSPWPRRLLSEDPYADGWVDVGYEPIYAQLLGEYEDDPTLTLSDLRRMEIGDFQRPVAISVGDGQGGEELFEVILGEAAASSDRVITEWVVEAVDLHSADTVVDLGCGWGYLLSTLALSDLVEPEVRFLGAEVTPSGVALARKLYPYHQGLVCQHDLNSGESCLALEDARGRVLVVTSFACHQLPSARPVVELLGRYREKVAAVVSYEPEESYFGDGLLGLLRRRYGEVRGYSADLLAVLGEEDVEVLEVRPNVRGANPLLPGTISVWRFR